MVEEKKVKKVEKKDKKKRGRKKKKNIGLEDKINCTIETAKMREFLKAVYALCDETKIYIRQDGWEIVLVDPAHVGLLKFDLPATEFEEYIYDSKKEEIHIAVDVEKILRLLNKLGNGITTIFIDVSGITVKSEGISRRFALLDVEDFKDTKIPELTLDIKLTLDRDDVKKLHKALKIINSFADYIRLQVKDGKFMVLSYDDDEEELKAEICKAKGDCVSNYPLDYFLDIVERIMAIQRAFMQENITIEFKKDYPVKVACGNAFYLLAPRIDYE